MNSRRKKRMGRNIFKYYEWEEKKSLLEEIKVWTWTEVILYAKKWMNEWMNAKK